MMTVGLVKEIKNHEYRVGLTPNCVKSYVEAGSTVLVETGAGEGSGFTDSEYAAAGGKIVDKAKDVWGFADMIVKVKEPVASEYGFLREDQVLYTYLHLAADRPLTEALLKAGTKAVAYETIVDSAGTLPCLTPMSEIAGRMSSQEGAKYLEKPYGGRGVLLAGVPGVRKANVVIIGGGVVGTNACKIAVGLGANVTIMDVSAKRLAYLDDLFGSRIQTLMSTRANIQQAIKGADLVIGAVLIPGRKAPKLILREDLALMTKGTVIVDVAIDQGGCFETSHPTTHQDPVFIIDGIVHYCVANMPGAVSHSSTLALTNSTLRYGLLIAKHGLEAALGMDAALIPGVNCYDKHCTCDGVAEAFGLDCADVMELIGARTSV
ncbi:MAG: alanine dehydrogenase [Planctomycetaceae bacterium]|nr:alanine dehydrogenase [Planctomycetaceae bacterium]